MTKIIAEIGINHDGSFVKCKDLIDMAARCGVWGVKFQYRNINNYFQKSVSNEIGKKIIDNELKRINLKKDLILKLAKYSAKKKLKTGISFFDIEDVEDFRSFTFDFYKIPSPVCDDMNLIKAMYKKNKLLLISLGGKKESEVIELSKFYEKIFNNKKKNVAILHCISNYPLSVNNSQLNFIDKLKIIFKNYLIGYSSHENDILGPVYSISKDINFLERHVTSKKTSVGLDHSSSSDEEELKKLCDFNVSIEISKKNLPRIINQGEKINIQNLGKSFVSKINQKKGSLIKLKNFQYKYPANGLSYLELSKFENKKLVKDIKLNEFINFTHIKKQSKFNEKMKNFCNLKKISLPIRPYDFQKINNKFNLKHYEFHLGFSDLKLVENFLNNIASVNDFKDKHFSVHLPDYCSEKYILNIFSQNKDIRKKSNKILSQTISFCKNIQKITKKKTILIGSFSSLENIDKILFYKKIKKLISVTKKRHDILISPQWLPPYAWYFGGSIKMYSFCDPEDLDIIKRLKFSICMDISHFILSCNFYNISTIPKLINKYKNMFNHFHISDAKGFDFEGLHLFEGDLKNLGILSKLINNQKIKVLEPWQGHINDYEIFANEIKKLERL